MSNKAKGVRIFTILCVKIQFVEEVGIVKNIEGAVAKIAIPKKNACEGCSLGICKEQEQSMEIEAINTIHARVGQKVRIVLRSYSYLQGSIIVYGIPAIGLIAGAVLGKELLSPYFPNLDPDAVSALFSFSVCILSFLAVKLWSRKAAREEQRKAVIEEILD